MEVVPIPSSIATDIIPKTVTKSKKLNKVHSYDKQITVTSLEPPPDYVAPFQPKKGFGVAGNKLTNPAPKPTNPLYAVYTTSNQRKQHLAEQHGHKSRSSIDLYQGVSSNTLDLESLPGNRPMISDDDSVHSDMHPANMDVFDTREILSNSLNRLQDSSSTGMGSSRPITADSLPLPSEEVEEKENVDLVTGPGEGTLYSQP